MEVSSVRYSIKATHIPVEKFYDHKIVFFGAVPVSDTVELFDN